jgi:carbon-monoxide dehydrogenase medium subunit
VAIAGIRYHRPASVAEAVRLMREQPEARALAGGQSLLPSIKLGLSAPEGFIDLAGIGELQGIRVEATAIRIGAMTTHAAVAESKQVRSMIPALARLAAGIGDRAVRNRGTLGGALAHSDPSACYPAAVLGLGATIHTDARAIAADDFFTGLYETALHPGELVTAVSFPRPEKAAWAKFQQPASRFSIVGVFVARSAGGVRVAVTGAGPCVFRAGALEARLNATFAPESCAGVEFEADGLVSDLHASAEFRAHLIGVLARRAVAAAS